MSILSKVTSGKQKAPPRIVLCAPPGVGKSTFASHAPSPIFADLEDGSGQLDVARLPPVKTWDEAMSHFRAISTEDHPYKTFVVDTLDALETLAVEHACAMGKKASFGDFEWGKGTEALVGYWRNFTNELELIRAKGIAVILIAHVHVKTFNDPQLGAFDRYVPKLRERVWALTSEKADLVAFCQFETDIYEKKGERARGIVKNTRIMRTTAGTGFFAKSRWNIPEVLPLDWSALQEAIANDGTGVDELALRLSLMLDGLGDGAVKSKAQEHVKKNGNTAKAILEAINAVQFKIEEKERAK